MLNKVEDNYSIYKRRRNALIQMGDCNIQMQDDFTAQISKSDEIITFIVGGNRYEVLKKNFAYWPTTRLSQLVRATTKSEILKYCDGFSEATFPKRPEYYFLNNWSNFNSILDKQQHYKTSLKHTSLKHFFVNLNPGALACY